MKRRIFLERRNAIRLERRRALAFIETMADDYDDEEIAEAFHALASGLSEGFHAENRDERSRAL